MPATKKQPSAPKQNQLRDQFATAALHSLLTMKRGWGYDEYAVRAYAIADALMEARKLNSADLKSLLDNVVEARM